jgi:hypothetical protein
MALAARFRSGVLISANVVPTGAHCVDDGTVTLPGTITTGFIANVPSPIGNGRPASLPRKM